MISIRSEFHFGLGEVVLRTDAESSHFRINQDQAKLEKWFSERLGQPVTLSHNPVSGFPDDDEASGPTLVSTATLEETATWFPGMTPEEVRRRFRPNLEIGGVPAFWEDRLFQGTGEIVAFRIGETTIEGIKPCARCTVPPRDSVTGESPTPLLLGSSPSGAPRLCPSGRTAAASIISIGSRRTPRFPSRSRKDFAGRRLGAFLGRDAGGCRSAGFRVRSSGSVGNPGIKPAASAVGTGHEAESPTGEQEHGPHFRAHFGSRGFFHEAAVPGSSNGFPRPRLGATSLRPSP